MLYGKLHHAISFYDFDDELFDDLDIDENHDDEEKSPADKEILEPKEDDPEEGDFRWDEEPDESGLNEEPEE